METPYNTYKNVSSSYKKTVELHIKIILHVYVYVLHNTQMNLFAMHFYLTQKYTIHTRNKKKIKIGGRSSQSYTLFRKYNPKSAQKKPLENELSNPK